MSPGTARCAHGERPRGVRTATVIYASSACAPQTARCTPYDRLGVLHGEVVSVAHTPREDDDHIISIRKATKYEARFYSSQIQD